MCCTFSHTFTCFTGVCTIHMIHTLNKTKNITKQEKTGKNKTKHSITKQNKTKHHITKRNDTN